MQHPEPELVPDVGHSVAALVRSLLDVDELTVCKPVDDACLGAATDRARAPLRQRRDSLPGLDVDRLSLVGAQSLAW